MRSKQLSWFVMGIVIEAWFSPNPNLGLGDYGSGSDSDDQDSHADEDEGPQDEDVDSDEELMVSRSGNQIFSKILCFFL